MAVEPHPELRTVVGPFLALDTLIYPDLRVGRFGANAHTLTRNRPSQARGLARPSSARVTPVTRQAVVTSMSATAEAALVDHQWKRAVPYACPFAHRLRPSGQRLIRMAGSR